MKKFKVMWYSGTMERCDFIIKEVEEEANAIDEVSIKNVLPEDIYKEIRYTRRTMISTTQRTVDYGSWSKFIYIEEKKSHN